MLTDGFHKIAPGHLATVVTFLEMQAPAPLRPAQLPDDVTLRRVVSPDTDWYRDLYYRVGGLDWLWTSRLAMSQAELRAILDDPGVLVWALEKDGTAEGLLELDFRIADECELAFFGLTKALIGSGAGRFLMNHAIDTAWSHPISRFHVHTCTFDSPQALAFYRRSGFTPVRQEVEIMADPRHGGALPPEAAPQIPLFSGET